MHEVGLASGVLEAVEHRAAGRRVLGAGVRVGASHRVSVASLAQGFELVAAGTVAEGAVLEVELVPTPLACGACGTTSSVEDQAAACPACGSVDVTLDRRDELVLTWIRVEDPAPST